MLAIRFTRPYKKSFKKLSKLYNFPLLELYGVIDSIAQRKVLDSKYKDHSLQGKFLGNRECHIRPDILLIYRIEEHNLVLILVNIGSHSNLFK